MRDSPDIFAWTCGLLLLLLGVAFSLELRRWLRRRTIITWRHMIIRALSTAVLGLLLVKLIWGAYHVGFNYSYHPDAFLQFWSRCRVLAYLALMSAAVDAWLGCRARRPPCRTRLRLD